MQISFCDFEKCNAILDKSKINEIIVNRSYSLDINILEWLEITSYEQFQTARSQGLSFGITLPIEGVPVGFDLDGDFSKEDYTNLQKHIKEGKVTQIKESELYQFVHRYVSDVVYEQWGECMKGMMDICRYGLQHRFSYNGKETVIVLRYIPYNESDPYPVVEEFRVPPNGECMSGCLVDGQKITSEHVIVVKRSNNEAGMITIDTDKGTITVPIKPVIEISELERLEAIKEVENYINYRFKGENGDLGNYGKVILEKFDVFESIINFQFDFYFSFGSIIYGTLLEKHTRMVGNLDLDNIELQESEKFTVHLDKSIYGIEEFTLYVKEVLNVIIPIVMKGQWRNILVNNQGEIMGKQK